MFESLPQHYGRRFAYTRFAAGHGPAAVKRALCKLEGAMLVSRVWPTTSLASPLQVKAKAAPKLLPLDEGRARERGAACAALGLVHLAGG